MKQHAINFRASADLVDKLTDLKRELAGRDLGSGKVITLTDVIATAIHDLWVSRRASEIMTQGIEPMPPVPDTHVGMAKKPRPGATVAKKLKRQRERKALPLPDVVKKKKQKCKPERNGQAT